MATIQSPGVGSGLNVNSIVTKLMSIEKLPLRNLDRKQSAVKAQISAYGQLKGKISDFQTAMSNLSSLSKFQVFNTVSNNTAVFTATSDNTASAGSYSVNVTALAARDKIATKGFVNTSSVVGQGTLAISVGANSFNVTIDATNDTVSGVQNAINSASANTGVTAAIVTDNAGAHIVLSSNNTGTANALKISVTNDSDGNNTNDAGLSSLAYDVAGGVVHRAAISTAADAVVHIDGFTKTSSSNTISGVLQGTTITAKTIGSSTLDVTRDDATIQASVQKFADSFNALRTEIKKQRKGQLAADSTLLTLERQIFGVLNSGASIAGSNQSYLIQAGVSIDKFGTMQVNSADLTKIMNTDFNSFANLFAAKDQGFAARLDTLAQGFLATDGLISARENGLNTQVKSIDKRKFEIQGRLVSIEKRIRAQFTALDTLVSSLQSTGNFLSKQLK